MTHAPDDQRAPVAPLSPAMTPERAHTLVLAMRSAQIVAALGLLVGAVSLRVVVAGEREIEESTAALRGGDAVEATVHARRAAGWYAPGAPHVRVAYERLIALATTAEGLGDGTTALLAWRAVRTAAIETRWLVTPHRQDLERANIAIARLLSTGPRAPDARSEPKRKVERDHLEALLRYESPTTAWVVALVVGFVAWTTGAFWFVRRAVGTTGHVAWQRARPPLLVTATGVALWLLAIWRA